MSPIWDPTTNIYEKGDSIAPVPSAARTASGNSGWLDSAGHDEAVLELDITAGLTDVDETIDVIVETAEDATGTNTRSCGNFTQKTDVANERKSFEGLDNFWRVRWTLAGTTPGATFSVTGEAR